MLENTRYAMLSPLRMIIPNVLEAVKSCFLFSYFTLSVLRKIFFLRRCTRTYVPLRSSHRAPESILSGSNIWGSIFPLGYRSRKKMPLFLFIEPYTRWPAPYWKTLGKTSNMLKMVKQCIIIHGMWTLIYGQYPIWSIITILNTDSEINQYWAACYNLIYYSSLPQTTFTQHK